MTPLILLTALFLCALINSFFFPPSGLLARLRSLYFKPPIAATSKKPPAAPSKDDDDDEQRRCNEPETIFPTFDSDGDGFITAKELEESLERLKLSATPEEVKEMMERVDANGDGMIDAEEFRELCESLEGRHGGGAGEGEVGLREAFGVFDGNGDGVITVEELGAVLVSMGLKQGAMAEDCRHMISRVDLDGDGRVNFEEFKKMMMATKAGTLL